MTINRHENKTFLYIPTLRFTRTTQLLERSPGIGNGLSPKGWTYRIGTGSGALHLRLPGVDQCFQLVIPAIVEPDRDGGSMTTIRHTEEEFQSLLRRLDLALEASNIGVWEHSLADDVVTWDLRMHKLYATGRASRVMPVSVWMDALHPDDNEAATREFEQAVLRKDSYESQFRIIWPDGQIRHIRSKANYYIDAAGNPAFIGVEWDVTADVVLNRELAYQQKIAEERAAALQASRVLIEHAAEHDYLTGLPNRRSFDRQSHTLGADDTVLKLAVMHIDLDRFKQINDRFGHEAGDLVLKQAASAIDAARMPHDFAARMGGDEFVLVCVNFESEDDLRLRAAGIIETINRGVSFRTERISVGASIGIAWNTRRNVEALLKDADLALYSAKDLGRGQLRFFSPELAEQKNAHRKLCGQLTRALSHHEFVPHYQIQRDSRSGKITGLEALARWQHPAHGLLLPESFVELAEAADLIGAIDHQILKMVLADMLTWEDRGLNVPVISLNVSLKRLADPSLLEEIDQLDICPGCLCFEIRPGSDPWPDAAVLANIAGLKARGIEIALTGLSRGDTSLMALLKIAPDRIKLDRSLIWPLTCDQEQLHIIGSLVGLARAFGMKVTAEGLESPDHADVLKNLGCDTLQGFGFGHPQPRDAVPLDSIIIKRDFKG